MRRCAAILGLSALSALVAPGCAPQIGDSCSSGFDCSVNGDRSCDMTRPEGSCTVFACAADNCPDDAICVRFRPEPSRLTFTACMRRCRDDGDCRFDEGFRCLRADEITTVAGEPNMDGDPPLAEIVDEMPGYDDLATANDSKFCVATEPIPDEEPEGD